MDFAKKILNKYGWKDGEGLGKNSDGIAKPLKASLKFDNAGFGTDQAADFNNHWWERVFNEAAGNLKVQRQTDGAVSMDLEDHDQSVEISTKGYSVNKLKKAKAKRGGTGQDRYNNFLQSATLTKVGDEVERTDKIELTDIAVTQFKTLTDDELFQACGGRTAHKGARHGLKLSGKLLRLEQQEQELLSKMQQAKNEKFTAVETLEQRGDRKENKRKKEAVEQNIFTKNEVCEDIVEDFKVKSSKKKKRQVPLEVCEEIELDLKEKKMKKSKRKITGDENVGDDCVLKFPKKKRKKSRGADKDAQITNASEVSKKPKKKKQKD